MAEPWLAVAVRVTGPELFARVVRLNPALIAPAGTITLAGTTTLGLLLTRATTVPPSGETELSVTVALAPVPLTSAPGLVVKAAGTGMMELPTVNGLLTVMPLAEADIDADPPVPDAVESVKLPVDCPEGMVILAGTVTTELLLASVTTVLLGAAILSVTVPVAVEPATTEEGAIVRVAGMAARELSTFSVLIAARPLAEAEMIAAPPLPDGVLMVKVALVWPAGMVTLDGTIAAALLLDRLTTVAEPITAALIMTVAVELAPAISVVGARTREEGAA